MTDYRSCRPAEYLKLGFTDEHGNMREGINGEFSLMMAYRLADSGVTSEEVLQLRKKLEEDFEDEIRAAKSPASAPPANTAWRLRESIRPLGAKAAPLAELIEAASAQMPDWSSFALFVHHLGRIGKQLQIITRMRKAPGD